jgi:hypothetical protein
MDTIKLATIYQFCADYHSGQWSRGYRLLCIIGKKLRKRGIARPIDQVRCDANLYNRLYLNYADKL